MALLSTKFAVLGALMSLASVVKAQEITGTYPPVALASKTSFTYPSGIPYKVDTDVGLVRGVQTGYNICNSTTENQDSLCQTSIVNSLDDFCLWAPIEPDSEVGSTEGEMVAWCTKPGHGTRLIPEGALTGVQFIKTSDYISVVGFIDQSKINILASDYGGEMDPHGADLRGNPMGGIMFSNAFGGGYKQVGEWHNFMGGNAFCLKACDPAGPNAAHFCEHIYDRIGCTFNVPNNAQNGTFESCLGENQDFPGVWTENGVAMTYTQPPEELGPITTQAYPVRVPASSQCTPFESAALYTGLPKAESSKAAESTAVSGSNGITTSPRSTGTSRASTASGPNATAGANSGAGRVAAGGLVAFVTGVMGFVLL